MSLNFAQFLKLSVVALLGVALSGCASLPESTAVPAATKVSQASLVTEEFRVPAETGIELYVRNKRPARLSQYTPSNVVVMVHGATVPAEAALDLPHEGMSWMDYIAAHGYDVYMLDVRGYGLSTRPAEMQKPAQDNPPIVTTAVASKDVGTVVDWVKRRRGIDKLNLIGWSWGTTIMANYTADNPANVNKLTLYAPQWIRQTPLPGANDPLGAYRKTPINSFKARWLNSVPEQKRADLIPAGLYEKFEEAVKLSDPEGAKEAVPVVRAPNGILADSRAYWASGKSVYDAGKITVPVLLVVGEWDADTPAYMAQTLFGKLTNAPYKRLVMVGEATHQLLLEKNRKQLFNEVQLFLDERH